MGIRVSLYGVLPLAPEWKLCSSEEWGMLETSNGNPALHETFRNRLVYNQRFLKMSVVTLLLFPSLGRGTPEGQGVGRRRNRAKPTSGATRHLLPEEGGRNRSKCIALYASSLKAGYSYSLCMKIHRLNGFWRFKRFTGFSSYVNNVYSKSPRRLDPSFLIRAKISFPIKGQHALGANPEPPNYISSSSWICSFFLQYLE